MKHKNDVEFNAKLYGKQKFSLRKLSIGLVAVTLGTTFYLTNGQLVHADENSDANGAAKTEVVENQSQDAGKSNSDSASTAVSNNEETGKQTDANTANTNAAETTVKNNASDKTDSDASSDSNSSSDTQTVNVADLTKSGSADASTLKENKSENQQTVTVEAHEIDENRQVTDKPAKSPMMAGQDNNNITIKIDHPQVDANNSITINFPDAGSGKSYKLNTTLGESDLSGDSTGHWHLNTSENKIVATWVPASSTIKSNPTDLTLSLPVQGNTDTIKEDTSNQAFEVQVGNQTYTAFTADLTPFKDKVQTGEILKGFKMGKTTVGSEKHWNNISSEDASKYNLTDDQSVNQWGIYFNYGSQKGATTLSPLMDAVFSTVFSGDQTMIPSSIKVYEVPANMAVDDSGYRHGENNNYIDPSDPNDPAQQATYYNKITSGTPDTTFKNYLVAHVTYDENGKPNGFAVDQSNDGLFNIDGNTDYASHAYFIQIDTVMDDPSKKPGDGTTIATKTSQTLNGKGITIDDTESWTGATSGGGGGQNETEAAHVRFYDDTDKKFIDGTPTLDASGVDTTPISFSDFNTAYGKIDSSKYQFVDITSGTQTAGADHEGTEISTDASNPNFGNYDSDPSVDQNFVVHFVHKTESVADQTATVTENVKYYYENGEYATTKDQDSNVPSSAYGDVAQTRTVTYTRQGTKDLVTGKVTYGAWTTKNSFDNQSFAEHLKGKDLTDKDIYSIDRSNIDRTTSDVISATGDTGLTVDTNKLNGGDKLTYSITVPYKLSENITVHYIDETTGEEITDPNLTTQYSGDPTTTKANQTLGDIAYLQGKHYLFDENATLGKTDATKDKNFKGYKVKDTDKDLTNIYSAANVTFDNDEDANNQNYYVYFIHDTKKNTETTTVKENVIYKYENGPFAGAEIPVVDGQYANNREATYERTNVTDLVTGKTTYGDWQQQGGQISFDEYSYPDSFRGTTKNATPGGIYKIDRDGITTENDDSTGVITEYDQSKDGRLNIDTSKLANGQTYTYSVTVPYKLTENIMVHFIDEDDNNGTEIATSKYTGDPKSTTVNNSQATLDALESEGYLLDSGATNGVAGSATNPNLTYDYTKLNFNSDNKLSDANLTFDNDENLDNQNYYIYLHHNVTTDTEEKTITENIKYIDEATKQEIHDQYQSGKLTLSRSVYTDKVTGKVTYSDWSTASFDAVQNPAISGYTIDENNITQQLNGQDSKLATTDATEIGSIDLSKLSQDELTKLPDGSTINFVVPYTQDYVPSQPTQPTQPTSPSQPTSPAPVQPQTPPTDNNKKNHDHHDSTTTVIPKGQDVDHSNGSSHKTSTVGVKSTTSPVELSHKVSSAKANKASENKSELPQTGEGQSKLGLIGLAFASLAGLIALAGDRKKKNN